MKLKLHGDVFEIRFKALAKAIVTWTFGLSFEGLVKPFRSEHYELEFFRFSDYWIEVGKRSALIDLLAKRANGMQGPTGYRNEEVLQKFARSTMGNLPCVILFNIDYSEIGKLWDRFPGVEKTLFQEEVVVLPTKNKDAARRLVEALPDCLACAIGFSEGEIFDCNYPF